MAREKRKWSEITMFDLDKEIDEIRLEYYIRNTAQNRLIEISLADVSKVLDISRSKVQRVVDKFIEKGILEVESKGYSKNSKTIYKYTDINTENNIVKPSKSVLDKVTDSTESDIDKMIDLFKKNFGISKIIEKELKDYCKNLEFEVFEYVLLETKNKTSVNSKTAYLLKTLKDMYSNNVKNFNDYNEYRKKHKTKTEEKINKKNWNYTEPDAEEDFELIAMMTRSR